MTTNWLLTAVILVGILLVGVVIFLGPPFSVDQGASTEISDPSSVLSIGGRSKIKTLDPIDANSHVTVMEVSRKFLERPLSNYPEPKKNDALVEVAALRDRDLVVGDRLSFIVPQVNHAFTVQLSSIEIKSSGIKVLKSLPNQSGVDYVMLILGEKNTLGNLFTPYGEFELIGDPQYAWLVRSLSLFNPDERDHSISIPRALVPPRIVGLRPGPQEIVNEDN